VSLGSNVQEVGCAVPSAGSSGRIDSRRGDVRAVACCLFDDGTRRCCRGRVHRTSRRIKSPRPSSGSVCLRILRQLRQDYEALPSIFLLARTGVPPGSTVFFTYSLRFHFTGLGV
jgi:hypothetical protein